MPALALSLVFFAYVAFIGRATLALCRWRAGVLRAWLLAPAVGLAVVVLAIMAFNQAGLPVGKFAWPSMLALGAAAAVIYRWRKPIFPLRALAPFAAIILFSLAWTGWPMARFNFGWLSYVNDDYVNYCLAADRFKDFGFWRMPTMEEFAGSDVSQYYWFMHVPGLMRFGSEILLAWVSAVSGVKTLGIFMPVIVGLGMIQIFSTGALVLHHGRWRRRAVVACSLLAVSPLFMLGTLYQLIAQVGGLALLLACTAILTARLPPARRWIFPHVAVLSIVGAALAMFYPEVTAFAVLTMLIVTAIECVRRRTLPTTRSTLVVYGIVGVIVLLRYNVLAYLFTILMQSRTGFREVDLSLSLFPYFMIPTGLANLFGLMPLSINFPEPVTSLTIVAGLLALLTAIAFALRETLRAAPIAVLFLVQFTLSLRLMTTGNDFGVYKLAMFMQPALAGVLAVALLKLPWSRWVTPLAVVAVAACCAPTALYYTRVSQGEKAGGITEAKLASILGTTPPTVSPGTRLLCDINNLAAAKVAAFELRGTDIRFLSRDYYQQIAPIEFEWLGDTLLSLHPYEADIRKSRAMLAERDVKMIRTHSLFDTSFRAPALSFDSAGKNDAYLVLDKALGLFNKIDLPVGATAFTFFKSIPAAAAKNHLVFVHSGRGNHYYLGDRNWIALYQQEADPYTHEQDITGLGRFLLLRVEQPDEEFYLRIAASKTFMGRGHTAWSPGSRVIGAGSTPLAFPGNGAVNRIVGPIRPVFRDGAAYIAIDFNEMAVQFPFKRTGLQSLYNTVVPLDSRKLVGYGRDISALSSAELTALVRPSRLSEFPHDILFARGLEFSGIYEDGWLSPESEFVLGGSSAAGIVRIRGFVPQLPGNPLGSGTMKIVLGGHEYEMPASTGTFDWLLPVPAAAKVTRLAMRFSSSALLPNGDDRPAGGKLELLEVLPALPTHTFEFGIPGRARLPAKGIDQDGWLARQASIELPAGGARVLALKVEFPDWSGQRSGRLTASLAAGNVSKEQILTPGVYSTMLLSVPASSSPQTLSISADGDFSLPAPDARRRAARLVQAELQPASE